MTEKLNGYKVTFATGEYYFTSANGGVEEFTKYLMQDDGRVTHQDPLTHKETVKQIVKIEKVDRMDVGTLSPIRLDDGHPVIKPRFELGRIDIVDHETIKTPVAEYDSYFSATSAAYSAAYSRTALAYYLIDRQAAEHEPNLWTFYYSVDVSQAVQEVVTYQEEANNGDH